MSRYVARRKFSSSRGFSLMELLVVLGIFSTVVTASTDIFMMASRAQRKVFALERAQADARFTMEAIAREVRTGTLDYDYYLNNGDLLAQPGPLTVLALRDEQNKPIRFFRSDSACANQLSSPCIAVAIGDGEPAPLTPSGVSVLNLRFYVSPATDPNAFDPATGKFAADIQPHVTALLALQTTSTDVREQSIVYLQTTVESRSYRR